MFIYSHIPFAYVACMALELMLFVFGYSKGEAFTIILNFSGGLPLSIVCFVMPAQLYLEIFKNEKEKAPFYYHCWCMFIFGWFTFFAVPIAFFV